MSLTKVEIYTDGSCSGNPGPGGYGTILVCGGKEKVISGGEKSTTNNRMELTAAIKGLEALKRECDVTLFSDSQYLVRAINEGWLRKWAANGWKKSDKSKVLNTDLWETQLSLLQKHSVKFVWVKGHDGHSYNERCDSLAVSETEKFSR